jgi:hypothetical protein
MNYNIRHWVKIINKLDPESKLNPNAFLDTIRITIDIPKKLPAKKVNRIKLAEKILRHIDGKAADIAEEINERFSGS